MAVEARDQLARDSSNWMQYKLTRDRQQFSDNLEDAVNTRWSQFKNKEELSDYLAMKRTESLEEREAEPGREGSEGISPPPNGYLSFFIKVFVFRLGLEQQ